MPRPKRIHYEGAVYHVTNRGNERRKIFWDDTDRGLFLQILSETIEHHNLHCHAWVLMDNHYHLLVETPIANLSSAMKHLNGIYTQKFNRRHHRVGHLFQGRYKAIHVDKDSYLMELCRYVVLNPVRAKLVEHPREWKWSSYRATAGIEGKPKWLETSWLLGSFGRRLKEASKAYKKFVEEGIGNNKSPWDEVKSGVFLGEEESLDKMGKLLLGEKNLDVPKYQKHILRPTPEKVLECVAKAYGAKVEEIIKSRRRGNEARDSAIYLLKKEAGLSSKEVGERLGMGSSGVGNRWALVRKRMSEEPKLVKKLLSVKCRPDP